MATQALTADRPCDAIIAALGGVSETNDRIAYVGVRPGMREGDLQGLYVRCWGRGHWCVCNGHASFFTDRAAALLKAESWIETGRSN